MAHHRITRTVLGPLAAAALLTLAACSGGGSDDQSPGSSEPTSQESSDAGSETDGEAGADSSAPELEGVPDVVAEVNGEEVTKDEFAPVFEARLQQALTAVQSGGQAPDPEELKKQTADDLVDTELLTQEAAARGISVSDEDVDAELGDLAKGYDLESADALLTALEEQGTPPTQARDQVRVQLLVEQLVEDEAGASEPTEAELRELYARAKEQAAMQGGQQLPPFAQVRAQLEEQAASEQVGEVANGLVAELREDAEITVHLE